MMQTKSLRLKDFGYHSHEWLYALVITAALLMVPACLCAMLWLLPFATAADNWQVQGAHGVLRLRSGRFPAQL